jgi:hypothetical protein
MATDTSLDMGTDDMGEKLTLLSAARVSHLCGGFCYSYKDYLCRPISHYNETEETENQVFGHILPLLVCPFGLSGGWSSEISDTG